MFFFLFNNIAYQIDLDIGMMKYIRKFMKKWHVINAYFQDNLKRWTALLEKNYTDPTGFWWRNEHSQVA